MRQRIKQVQDRICRHFVSGDVKVLKQRSHLQCKFPLFCLPNRCVDAYRYTVWWLALHIVIFTDDKSYKVCGHGGRGGKLHFHKIFIIWIWLSINDILETETDHQQWNHQSFSIHWIASVHMHRQTKCRIVLHRTLKRSQQTCWENKFQQVCGHQRSRAGLASVLPAKLIILFTSALSMTVSSLVLI